MELFKKYFRYVPLILLIILVSIILFFVIKNSRNNQYLKVVFLDVGQGDSIYIEAPNGKQILIDGGPDAQVLSSLGKVIPFADRSIDMVIVTHSDTDHIGGLPILMDNYSISNIIESGNISSSSIYKSLEERVLKNKINKIIARKGMRIILDDKKNIYLDILFPDRDVSDFDSNDSSVVGRLVYGENSFLFTGDASLYTENLIEWSLSDENLDSDVLKLGHHGSRTSSSILWLKKVTPEVAIVSAGKDNKYGHPHKELIERLFNLNIPYLNTADLGNIIFKSDGVNLTY